MKHFSKHTKSNEFVFPKNDGTLRTLRENIFANLMEASSFDKYERKLTWYSCRHFYTTKRIEKDLDVYLLANQMGTSFGIIKIYYEHK